MRGGAEYGVQSVEYRVQSTEYRVDDWVDDSVEDSVDDWVARGCIARLFNYPMLGLSGARWRRYPQRRCPPLNLQEHLVLLEEPEEEPFDGDEADGED